MLLFGNIDFIKLLNRNEMIMFYIIISFKIYYDRYLTQVPLLVSSGPYDIFDIVTSYPFQLGKVHFVKPEIKLKIHRPIIQRLHLFYMNYSTRFKVSSYICKYVTEKQLYCFHKKYTS